MKEHLKITSGQAIVKIKSNDLGSYFVIDNPLSIVWNDCQGSIGQYFTLTHYSNIQQKYITEQIQNNLYNEYSNNNKKLIEDFSEFWRILENGEYEISLEPFLNSDESLFLSYNESLRMTNETIFNKWKSIEKNPTYVNLKNTENVGYFSNSFYGSYGDNCFLFTRAMESINNKRVKFFEEEIKEGKRPFALILRKEYTEKDIVSISHANSGWFIVDGHHKLLAYQNLNIAPPLLKIRQIVNQSEYDNFNINELDDLLMNCQLKHMKENM